MIKKFIPYYKPHFNLFLLSMSSAFGIATLTVAFPWLTGYLLREALPSSDFTAVALCLGGILGVYIISTILEYIKIKWGHIMGVRMEYDMRHTIFRHLQKLSFTWYDNTKTGHIMSRISNDLNQIAEVAHHGPEDLLLSVTLIAGGFIIMFFTHAPMALMTCLPLPVMLWWGIKKGTRLKASFKGVREEIAEINSAVENSVQGIREVKAYGSEEREIGKFSRFNKQFRKAKVKAYQNMAGFHSVMYFLRNICYLNVVASGSWFIYKGSLDVTGLLTYLLYMGIILPPIDRLISFVEQYTQGMAAFERFQEIMDLQPDITDREEALSPDSFRGNIEFRNVSFTYKGAHDQALKGINLTINPGETIGLVGQSGAGKSTLAALIPRFYTAPENSLYLDGNPIEQYRQQFLKDNIGIVQQAPFLFDDTLKENILFGQPGAGEEEIKKALESACLTEFINSLPEGLKTLTGERGVKLSGGQRQRIALARVLLKDPPFFIFDEATSALDNESEARVQKALYAVSEGRTTVIIAHRLSTVRNADRLVVLKDGRIEEMGSHEELLAKKGYYSTLWENSINPLAD